MYDVGLIDTLNPLRFIKYMKNQSNPIQSTYLLTKYNDGKKKSIYIYNAIIWLADEWSLYIQLHKMIK